MLNLVFISSISGLFRILLICFLAYYILSLLFRYVVPLIIKYSFNRMHHTFTEQSDQPKNNSKKKEGEVTIEVIDESKKTSHSHSEDDYIDYEEIK